MPLLIYFSCRNTHAKDPERKNFIITKLIGITGLKARKCILETSEVLRKILGFC